MSGSSTRHTLIFISDSRGKGWAKFIKAHASQHDLDHVTKILPGKDLNFIVNTARRMISKLRGKPFYCVILAGICSLTVKSTVNNKNRLHYPLEAREGKVKSLTDTIHEIKSLYKYSINICFLIPASLHKYFEFHNKSTTELPAGLEDEQLALNADIIKINDTIDELNSDVTNINLYKRVQTNKKKKKQRSKVVGYRRSTKFSDKELFDGLHFSNKLKLSCFTLILNTAVRDIRDRRFEEDSQESQVSDNEWDFKRKQALLE